MTWFRHDLPLRSDPWPFAARALTGFLAIAGIAFCVLLWREWKQNADLSHGFVAPFVFLFLARETSRLGPLRWINRSGGAAIAQPASVLLGIAAFAFAGLFAAAVGWSHSLVLFLVAVSFASFLFAGYTVLADERVRIAPFNWVGLTAILLWVLVAPLPSGTYARLTLSLQSWVTGSVMEVLQFLGIPARQHGNVIELTRTTVGVEEACSGVRSLISCLYAGFFFAAWLVRRPARRVLLVVIAPLLALVMNLVRSLTLTLLANGGVDISGTWHDLTGYAVLAATSAILAALALKLETAPEQYAPVGDAPKSFIAPLGRYVTFWSGAVVVAALAVFYAVAGRRTSPDMQPAPVLEALLPASIPGWQVRTPDDLYQFSGILQTTTLLQRTYTRRTDRGMEEITAYVAYWPAGQTSVSRVASHTPDACWPGSGWNADPGKSQHRLVLISGGAPLAPTEYRIFHGEQTPPQHVWFWHVFDGRVIDYRDPYSIPALLQIAVNYGFRRQGSQYFIRLSSNRSWGEIATEPLTLQLVEHLRPLGL